MSLLPYSVPLLTKLGLDGIEGDGTGITEIVADWLNQAWDFLLDAVRVVVYALLAVPLIITSALSDAVDVISGIKPIYTDEGAIFMPYAGEYPPCRYDDFIVFDSFYFVTDNRRERNRADGTRIELRYGIRRTQPRTFTGDWTPYGDVPDISRIRGLFNMFTNSMQNGRFISDFIARSRVTLANPDGLVTMQPVNGVNAYNTDPNFSNTTIAQAFFRNGYEPDNYNFGKNPDLFPYYMRASDAFNLRDNRLNRQMRNNFNLQMFEYDPNFFVHVQLRQEFYHPEFGGGFIRGLNNHYSIMFLYSARPLWEYVINNMEGIREGGVWTAEFLEYCRANDLAPGSEAMYRHVANSIAEGVQIHAPVNNPQGGETLLSILVGQSVISFAFWGITLISAALCLIFTIIAVTRSMGDLDGKRPIGKVMGDTAKAMLTFLMIPVMMIVAVNLSMVVLRQVNMVMDNAILGSNENINVNMATAILYTSLTPDSMRFKFEEDMQIEMAYNDTEVRQIRREGYQPTEEERENKLAVVRQNLLTGRMNWMNFTVAIRDVDPFFMNYIPTFITAWFSVVIMVMVLLLFIQRIYDMLLLYLAAPFFVSVIPLDEGQKFKAWREMFIAKTIEGFSSIITLKLFLIFLPLLWDGSIAFHYIQLYDLIVKCLFMIGGMYAAYKSHTMITGLFNKQAEAMEKETSAFGQQIVSAAKDTAMAPVNFIKENVSDDVNKKLGDARSSAAQGLRSLRGKAAGAMGSAGKKAAGAAGKGISNAGKKAAGALKGIIGSK
jgi:hypothetical protein